MTPTPDLDRLREFNAGTARARAAYLRDRDCTCAPCDRGEHHRCTGRALFGGHHDCECDHQATTSEAEMTT